MIISWKMGSWNRKKSRVSGLCVSYPKSGRTWLRYMLEQLGVELQYVHGGGGCGKPVHHEKLEERIMAKIPRDLFEPGPVLFLRRNPLDLLVSSYFQSTKRKSSFKGSIREFMESPQLGIEKIIRYDLLWMEVIRKHNNALTISYEELKSDTTGTLRLVADFMDVPTTIRQLRTVAASGDFDRMQKASRDGELVQRFRPGDPQDPESYKVRRGKVGGWSDYLTAEDVEYCKKAALRMGAEWETGVPEIGRTTEKES